MGTPKTSWTRLHLPPQTSTRLLLKQGQYLRAIDPEGDAIILRAEMDLLVAVAACAAATCNGGRCKPIELEVSP